MCYGILLAAAFAYESDHHALRNVGQGHVVLEEGGEEEFHEAREAEGTAGGATTHSRRY